MTPPTTKQTNSNRQLTPVVKKKSTKLRFGSKVSKIAPKFKSKFPVQVQQTNKRLRVLKEPAKAKSTLPKSFLSTLTRPEQIMTGMHTVSVSAHKR